ncbi:hypothetical protein AO263_17900 [Pseudomonas sp. NZIPFR-PS5]|nr:hypothetical protein AO263_17900 [Pseudomonas sp. NZIPFR-PS5]
MGNTTPQFEQTLSEPLIQYQLLSGLFDGSLTADRIKCKVSEIPYSAHQNRIQGMWSHRRLLWARQQPFTRT